MKLLFVLPGLGTGGTLSSFVSLYSVLKNQGHNICIYALSHQGNPNQPFVDDLCQRDYFFSSYYEDYSEMNLGRRILSLPVKLLKALDHKFSFGFSERIMKRKAKRLDDIHFDCAIAFQEDLPTLFVSFFEMTRKVAWIHCNYKCRYNPEHSELSIYDRFDSVVNVSKYTMSQFIDIYPTLKDKCVTIYNLLNTNEIISKSTEYDVKEFDNNFFNIVSVGRISSVKRFSRIPEIVRGLDNNIRWYVVGPVSEQKEYESLVSNIKKYHLEDRVILTGGKSNPYPYIKQADLLVCVSESEACPMIFNEAKIFGTPILSTDFGSAYEFIEEGKSGWICSIEQIGEKVHNLRESGAINSFKALELGEFDNYNESIINKFNSLIKN